MIFPRLIPISAEARDELTYQRELVGVDSYISMIWKQRDPHAETLKHKGEWPFVRLVDKPSSVVKMRKPKP